MWKPCAHRRYKSSSVLRNESLDYLVSLNRDALFFDNLTKSVKSVREFERLSYIMSAIIWSVRVPWRMIYSFSKDIM